MKEFKATVIKALLPHIILLETSKPMHGYELIKLIRRKHGVNLGASTIYPALNDLESQGLITSQWIQPSPDNDRPRKVYTITNKGKILLGQTSIILNFVNKSLIEVKTA